MDRGLRTQRSPKEETELQKVAAGSVEQDQIQLAHLAALQLIEMRDGKWQLTAIGHARMAGGKTTPN